jgi:hypothetical protein
MHALANCQDVVVPGKDTAHIEDSLWRPSRFLGAGSHISPCSPVLNAAEHATTTTDFD